MTKTGQSCIWSIRELLSGKKWAYLWTFTFKDVIPVPVACERWRNLNRDLKRHIGIAGVRVFELHPDGHGLHVHLVTAGRFDVRAVRHYSSMAGFGRIHVKPIPADSADYIAKYLQKASRSPELKGRRLWQCVGAFSGHKVKDCEIDSPMSREISAVTESDIDLFHSLTGSARPPAGDIKKVNWSRYLIAFGRRNSAEFRSVMRGAVPSVSLPDLVSESASVDRFLVWLNRVYDKKNALAGVPF